MMKGKIYRNKALDLENMTLESPLGTQFQLKKTLSNSNILTSNYPINNNLEREALLQQRADRFETEIQDQMNFDRRKFGSAADYIKQYERRVRERLLRTEHQHELVVQQLQRTIQSKDAIIQELKAILADKDKIISDLSQPSSTSRSHNGHTSRR